MQVTDVQLNLLGVTLRKSKQVISILIKHFISTNISQTVFQHVVNIKITEILSYNFLLFYILIFS